VSDCSGYFFAKQKSLSEKRDAAGLPAGARPNMKAKIIRQKTSGKKQGIIYLRKIQRLCIF
jgi:hypothetical protein